MAAAASNKQPRQKSRLLTLGQPCACLTSAGTCSCPLRTDELAPITTMTTRVNSSSSSSSNKIADYYQLKQQQESFIIKSTTTKRQLDMQTTRQRVAMTPTTSGNNNCQLVNNEIIKDNSNTCSAKSLRRNSMPHRHLLITCSLLVVLSLALSRFLVEAALYDMPAQYSPTFSPGPSLCPLVSSCHCKWSNGKQGAICDKRDLTHIPSQLPSDTQVLDLSGNHLQHLPAHVFQDKHLTNLQKLFLSDCKISFIADEAFAQLTNLIELDLSHNNLQFVPTKSLGPIHNSLRKLILSHNPIQTIESNSFSALVSLTTLDISNCQLSQLKANAFSGLNSLKELKLNDNRLMRLPMNVTSDLKEYLDVDLYANPWYCDCELRESYDWLLRRHIQQSMTPTCGSPQHHKDIRWHNIKPEEFQCPPVIIERPHEIVVGAGSNITLLCQTRGSPRLNFIWYQDDRNLSTIGSEQSEPLKSTKLLEEMRFETAEEEGPDNVTTSILLLKDLRITDSGMFLCAVENLAGSAWTNYTVIVNNSPPSSLDIDGSLSTSSGQPTTGGGSFLRSLGLDRGETQAGLVGLLFLVILLAAIVVLVLILRQNYASSAKGSQSSGDLKHHKAIESLSSASKFSSSKIAAGRRANLNSDEDDEDDYYDEDQSANDTEDNRSATDSNSVGSSSCRKNNGAHQGTKVMAASDLDGFIEHMRSGIINMDYHTMSPVIQFNNTLKKPQPVQQQQQQQQVMSMSHFPSASKSSSNVPYYSADGGSNSMATTMSDLSPSSGSGNVNFAPHHNLRQQQQHLTTLQANCDLQHQLQNQNYHHQQHHLMAPATNTTTTSYTSDYQSGYGADNLMQQGSTLYYESAQPADFYDGTQLYNGVHLLQQQQQQPHRLDANSLILQEHLMQQQQQQVQVQVAPGEANQRPQSVRGVRAESGFQI